LFKRTQRGPIVGINPCQRKSPATIVSAPGIELSAVVRERKQMTFEKRFESGAGRFHARFGFFKLALSGQDVGKTPIDLRIANRNNGSK